MFWAGNLRDAEKVFRATLRIAPNLYEGWQNLGSTYTESFDLERAKSCLMKAVQIDPSRPTAYLALAVAYYLGRNCKESIFCGENALRLNPSDKDANLIVAQARLLSGDWANGWSSYEKSRLSDYNMDFPLWSGEDVQGKRVLLLCEQGYGDDLHFIRYAKPLHDLGAYVIVGCKPPLTRIFRNVPGVDKVVPFDSLPPDFDFYCPLMRLPFVFKTEVHSIPADIPYLFADEGYAIESQKLKVGLCWAGAARKHDPKTNRIDRRRSISLDEFDSVLSQSGADFFSLQKGDGAEETHPLLDNFAVSGFRDFFDTASFMLNLDLVITVDTSVAHLAGGLGKEVWMLSRFDGCWRWLMEGDKSPWYPTMTIFRQEKPGDWSGVINRVIVALRERTLKC